MSRVKELEDALKKANQNGGMGREDWKLHLLTDISVSLARIVDALEKRDEE